MNSLQPGLRCATQASPDQIELGRAQGGKGVKHDPSKESASVIIKCDQDCLITLFLINLVFLYSGTISRIDDLLYN